MIQPVIAQDHEHDWRDLGNPVMRDGMYCASCESIRSGDVVMVKMSDGSLLREERVDCSSQPDPSETGILGPWPYAGEPVRVTVEGQGGAANTFQMPWHTLRAAVEADREAYARRQVVAARREAADLIERELHHASDNGHVFGAACQGVAPGKRVPAVRADVLAAVVEQLRRGA